MTPQAKPDFKEMAREIVDQSGEGAYRDENLADAIAALAEKCWNEGRTSGLYKAANICLYHRDKSKGLVEAYKAGCDEVRISCLATAGRIERGEYEDPTSSVMATPQEKSE